MDSFNSGATKEDDTTCALYEHVTSDSRAVLVGFDAAAIGIGLRLVLLEL